MVSKEKKPRKRLLTKLGLSLFSLLAFMTVLEVGTRLLWEGGGYDYVGIALRGANKKKTVRGIEYALNDHGIRDRHDVEKRPGMQRILVLGDSFVFGDGVVEEDTLPAQLELEMRKTTPDVEVINAGLGGLNTRDELRMLKTLAPVYDPDFVVLAFFTNDVLALSPKSADAAAAPRVASWKQRVKERLRRKSKFCAFLYYMYKGKIAAKIGTPKNLLPADYFDLDDSKPGWVDFKEAALEIQQYCRDRDSGFLFAFVPTLTGLNENYPYQELREATCSFAEGAGMLTVDLFDVLSPYEPIDLWVDSENTHWNVMGTQLAAAAIADRIRSAND